MPRAQTLGSRTSSPLEVGFLLVLVFLTQGHMIDGGIIDNFGLNAMLRRGIKRLVVFVNESTPFPCAALQDAMFDKNGKDKPDTANTYKSLNACLPACFGYGWSCSLQK